MEDWMIYTLYTLGYLTVGFICSLLYGSFLHDGSKGAWTEFLFALFLWAVLIPIIGIILGTELISELSISSPVMWAYNYMNNKKYQAEQKAMAKTQARQELAGMFDD